MALDQLFMSLSSCTKKSSTTRIPPTKQCSNCILRIFSLWWSIFDVSDIGGLCAQLLGGIFSAAQLFGRSVPCPTVIFHLQCGLKRICHRLWGGFEPLCRNWLCEASVGSQPWEQITRLAFLTPSLPPAVQLLWSTSRRRGSVSSVTHALHVPDFQSGDMTPTQFLLHPTYPLHCDTHAFRESWYSRRSPTSYPSQSCKLRSCGSQVHSPSVQLQPDR